MCLQVGDVEAGHEGSRSACVSRRTSETSIDVSLDLDGSGKVEVSMGAVQAFVNTHHSLEKLGKLGHHV